MTLAEALLELPKLALYERDLIHVVKLSFTKGATFFLILHLYLKRGNYI